MNKVNIGIIGYGVVGRSTLETLIDNKELIQKKTGLDLHVMGVADRSLKNKADNYLKKVQMQTDDPFVLLNNSEIDIIVELIGGDTTAKDIFYVCISKGKHIVTANKALLAKSGKELFDMAGKADLQIGYEASVAGGIPIINVIKDDLVANNIDQITAILNGTSNYILTRMYNEGKEYNEVLSDAQKLGYAEADPTFDVEGIDAAHKIAILSTISFGKNIDFDKVYVEGITNISSTDINFAKELGCVIKLLAISKKVDEGIEVRVHPAIIPNEHALASVSYADNAVSIKGDKSGFTTYYGKGAGGNPTSSAVVSDIVRLSKIILSNSFSYYYSRGFSVVNDSPMLPIDNISSAFYLRFTVDDNPGVLSTISGIMADHGISIRSALQRIPENSDKNNVPLVFITHSVKNIKLYEAVAKVDKLSCIKDKTIAIRFQGVNV